MLVIREAAFKASLYRDKQPRMIECFAEDLIVIPCYQGDDTLNN